MSIRKNIFELLSNESSVYAIVNGSVFPLVAKTDQDAPYVIYSINKDYVYDLQGCVSYVECFVSVQCYHNSYEDAVLLSERVHSTLLLNQVTLGGVYYSSTKLTRESDAYDDDILAYNVTLEFEITINEGV